MTVHWSKSIVS